MRPIHCVMIASGLLWLAAVVWLINANTIAREIRPIGAIAEFLDKLPPVVGGPIFLLLWLVFLLGWIAPLTLGVRPMFRRRSIW